jgi:hypothetical protein
VDDIAGREQSKDLSVQVGIGDIGASKVEGLNTDTGEKTYSGDSFRLTLGTPSFGGGWSGSQVKSWNFFTFQLKPPSQEMQAPPRPDDTPGAVEVEPKSDDD